MEQNIIISILEKQQKKNNKKMRGHFKGRAGIVLLFFAFYF